MQVDACTVDAVEQVKADVGLARHVQRFVDEGLGLFLRYAVGDQGKTLPTKDFALDGFWSFGVSYKGLIPSRDEDVLGWGYAIADHHDYQATTTRLRDEQVFEWYYKIQFFPWLDLTPSVQYILHPGFSVDSDDAIFCGLRLNFVL